MGALVTYKPVSMRKFLFTTEQVPQIIPTIIFLLELFAFHQAYHHVHCQEQALNTFYQLRPESSQHDYSLDNSPYQFNPKHDQQKIFHREQADSSVGPTPPLDLDLVFSYKNKRFASSPQFIEASGTSKQHGSPPIDLGLYQDQHLEDLAPDLQQLNPLLSQSKEALTNDTSSNLNSPESTDGFDLIELGLSGWPVQQADDTYFNFMEDTTTIDENTATLYEVQPTAVLRHQHEMTNSASIPNEHNRAPALNRRLPKIVVTAGLGWHYSIPHDTFLDEDGDLRQLKLTIMEKKLSNVTNSTSSYQRVDSVDKASQYFAWIQYDEASQMLYGLPTEKDVGLHEFLLVVVDRWGSSNEETFEVNVRQHQSARAHTHLFSVNRVEWDLNRYPSMVSALRSFTKFISLKIYNDQADNMVIRYYRLNNLNTESNNVPSGSLKVSFDIAWFNGSVPIHPCNVSQIEQLFELLIDSQALGTSWSMINDAQMELPPSKNLQKALEYEFLPTSVNVQLMGACENRDSSTNETTDNIDLAPRVKIKIGKLTWKLGQPIEYKIPTDTFTAEKGSLKSSDMQLSLHTIDGLPLDKDNRYNFLDFDQESQTLYGLPYDQTNHSGQRELQLTARHPKTQEKVREVFVVNIEPQDLTSINNRAFKMSLYLNARTMVFGPRERVLLTHKIIEALMIADYSEGTENSDLIVTDVQRFTYGNDIGDRLDQRSQDRIIRVIDNRISNTNYFYKFSWTNSTIGNRGDCPVEVIKENILLALEQSMSRLSDMMPSEETAKNDSARFFDRLHMYFEPESDLIHLRFEPLGACMSALELHDVGNSDMADRIDRASEVSMDVIQEVSGPSLIMPTESTKKNNEPVSDEYWSIVVLIVLVIALIFVIIMFFLGMHTYKINQDKRFELQVKLAQARQNSMYLSSMMIASQANGYTGPDGPDLKPLYVIPEEEKGPRKPVILDNEKQLLTNGVHKSHLAVQTTGQTYQTTPFRPHMAFALDGNSKQDVGMHYSPSLMSSHINNKQKSATLHRQLSNQRLNGLQNQMHPSHSILTVASLARAVPAASQVRLPVVYAHQISQMAGTPVVDPGLLNYSSLQRQPSFQKSGNMHNGNQSMRPTPYFQTQGIEYPANQQHITEEQYSSRMIQQNGVVANGIKATRSPSYTSSNSMTTQSVISNPNYVSSQNQGFL